MAPHPPRSAASIEQRRQYQEDLRRARGTPTRAEANAAMTRPALVMPAPIPLADQHPMYAAAIEALGPIVRSGADLVWPAEWIREDELQAAVLAMLEERRSPTARAGPGWRAIARRLAGQERRRQLIQTTEQEDGRPRRRP